MLVLFSLFCEQYKSINGVRKTVINEFEIPNEFEIINKL